MSERNASVLTSLQATLAPHCVWCSAGVATKAKERPEYRFRDLFRLLNEDMLRDSWRFIRKDAAFGVDRVSAAEYEHNLEANIHQLVEELKRKRYRAKNALRRYIPKEKGKLRPLGIPAIQDKLYGLNAASPSKFGLQNGWWHVVYDRSSGTLMRYPSNRISKMNV